jgi:transposase, IS5 family
VEYFPLLVIKEQFGFLEIRLQGMSKSKSSSKMNILAALTNLFLARRQLLPSS